MNWMNVSDSELRKTISAKENDIESLKTRKMDANKGMGDLAYSGRKRTKDPTP